jgi:peroxiredoxin
MVSGNHQERKGGAPAPPGFTFRRIVLFAILLLSWGFFTGMGSKPPQVGGPAPPFTLNNVEGRPVSLADYKGKVVLLNFWATWCEPCKKEMPEIQAAYEQYKDRGFVVLGINFGENPDPAASFVHHGRLTFPVLLDRKIKVAEQYGVINLPVTFFVDPEGVIRERVVGGTLTAKGIGEIVQRLQEKK